jgi:hypothetical protein
VRFAVAALIVAVTATSAATGSTASPSASVVPTSAAQQIAGSFGIRAYLPSFLPAGYLYTGWQRAGFGSPGDLTVSFARAGKTLTWSIPSEGFDCPAFSFEPHVRIASTTVYRRVRSGVQTAWICVGSSKDALEISASDKRTLSAATLEPVVASARRVPAVPPPQIVVSKSAFQQHSSSSGTSISCELELTNRSTTTDAIGVDARVSFVDSLGRSVAQETTHLTGIPAGATVAATCGTFSNVSLSISALQVSTTITRTQPKELALPPVGGIRIMSDQYGFISLSGPLTNPYAKPLPSSATIYALYLDGAGNLIGGDEEDTGASVQPQATVGFGFDLLPDGATTALVTIDPCGGFELDPADCPALTH